MVLSFITGKEMLTTLFLCLHRSGFFSKLDDKDLIKDLIPELEVRKWRRSEKSKKY